MASVTFPTEYGGDGKTYTDDADPTTGLDGTGYITRFVPTLAGSVAMAAHATQKADDADQSAQSAGASAQQASDDRDSINLDLQTLNGLVAEADASADAAAGSATTASNMADAVAEATATYTSVSVGLAATVDTNYFRVIEAPEAARVSVYRNDAGAATLITTYYTKTGVDAKQAAAVRLNRSLQRLGDYGQTLHSDFNLNAYGLGNQLVGGVQDAMEAEELWSVERLSGTYALQHVADGSLKYVYVPPNVLAREWNPETGNQAQISGAVTNELLWSTQFDNAAFSKGRLTVTPNAIDSPIEGFMASKITADAISGTHYIDTPVIAETSTNTCPGVVIKAGEYTTAECYLVDSSGIVSGTSSIIDLAISETNNGFIDDIGGGWKRFYLPNISNGKNIRLRVLLNNGTETSFTGDGESGIYIAHAQLVEGNTPGPIIVTEEAPVTRAADNISRELGAEFNGIEFSGYFEFYGTLQLATGVPSGHCLALARNSSSDSTPRVSNRIGSDGTHTLQILNDSGGVWVSQDYTSRVQSGLNRVAYSINANDNVFSLSVNGQILHSQSVGQGGSFKLLERLWFGSSAQRVSLNAESALLIPKYLAAEQLQELTAL